MKKSSFVLIGILIGVVFAMIILSSNVYAISSFKTPPTTAARVAQNITVGFWFNLTQNITITRLGRLYVAGNTYNHTVYVWDVANQATPLVSGNISASSTSDSSNFKWVDITPTQLTIDKTYALAVDEYSPGDTWKDDWLASTSMSSVIKNIYEKYGYDGVTRGIFPGANGVHTTNYMYDTGAFDYLDYIKPNATLLNPSNNSYLNTPSYNFTVNVSDDTLLANATIFIYNSSGLFYTNTTSASGTSGIIGINVSGFIDGVYTWAYSVYDNVSNVNSTSNRTVTFDLTYPLIDFDSVTPQNDSSVASTNSIVINVSLNDSNLVNVSLTFTGQSNVLCNRTSTSVSFSCNNVNSTIYNISSSGWIFTYNKTGIAAATSYYYQATTYDIAGNTNSTQTRKIRGNGPPSLGSLVYTPSSNSSIDPVTLITISANVTDSDGNMGSAILEWINSSQAWSEANRTLMSNITAINSTNSNTTFIVNITTPNYEDSLQFRIYANDTAGESANLTSYGINSRWDCTWNLSTTNLGTTGGFYITKDLGNITISNTGDSAYSDNNCSIIFARTNSGSAWTIRTGVNFSSTYLNLWNANEAGSTFPVGADGGLYYYVNGSKVTSFNLNVSSNATLNIKADFPRASYSIEENPSFSIASSIADSDSGVRNYSVSSKIVITPGAYLEIDIESPPSTIYLTPGNTTIKAYVKNVVDSSENSNNTAYNVSFNWSIPSTISSLLSSNSNISLFEEFINNTAKRYLNITIELTSSNIVSLSVANYSLYIYSSGYENSSGQLLLINHTSGSLTNVTLLSDYFNLNFSCYGVSDGVKVTSCGSSDSDNTVTSTSTSTGTSTGGGGGGGGGSAGNSKFIKEEKQFELVRGKQNSFIVEFKNPYSVGQLENLKISLSGLLSEYIKINPSEVSKLVAGETLKISAEITAPKYFNEGKYELNLVITGNQKSNVSSSSLNEQKKITLYVYDISRDGANTLISNSEKYLETMKNMNFTYKELEKLLEEIKNGYNQTDFSIVSNKYNELKTIYDNAMNSYSIINDLRAKIEEAKLNGIDAPETEKLVNLAESAFLRGDYSLSIARLKEAQLSFALETKGEFNLAYYVIRNPLESAGMLVGLIIFATGTSLFVRKRLLKNKLRLLNDEEQLLIGLMRVVQKECFTEGRMSMEEYENTMSQYEGRLNSVIQDKIETETKIANIMKIKGGKKKALNEEKERLKEMIKQTQKLYFDQSKVETRVYENMVKSYSSRLADVEEKIATIEAREALKKFKVGR